MSDALRPPLAQGLVAAAASEAIASRRAELTSGADPHGRFYVTLEPREPDACPLTLGFGVPGEAHVSLGRSGGHFEIWESNDLAGFEAHVRDVVVAVVRGSYEEWVSPLRGVKGVLRLSSGRETFCTNTLGLGAGRMPWWRHVKYSPYVLPT